MKREIKFRAWNIQKKEFNNSYLHLELNGELLSMNYSQFDGYESNVSDRYELIEFTGLHDSKGVEIYEGDVVQYPNPACIGIIKFGEFHWTDGYEDSEYGIGFYIDRKDQYKMTSITSNESKTLEVIGNIYSNPELL